MRLPLRASISLQDHSRGYQAARRFRAGQRAIAAVEFALTLPALLIVLGGTVDFGMANYSRMAMANAISSGAQYAYLTKQSGGTLTAANIKTLVETTSYLTGLTATITGPAGYCVTGSGPTMTSATTGSTCSDGSTAGTYVIISGSYSYTGLLGGYAYPSLFSMSESAAVRLQ